MSFAMITAAQFILCAGTLSLVMVIAGTVHSAVAALPVRRRATRAAERGTA